MSKIGDSAAVLHLADTLKDKNPEVRLRVVDALEKIGDERAVMPLINALKDEDPDVRSHAAKALAIGDGKAVAPLVEALKDDYSMVKDSAGDALVKIGDGRTARLLEGVVKHKNCSVRDAAIRVLGNIGAVAPLIAALKAEYCGETEAAKALLRIVVSAVAPLTRALKDRDKRVRINAAWLLGRIGDKRAVSPLIEVLKDRNWEVCSNAAEALGMLGDNRAEAPLVQSLKYNAEQPTNYLSTVRRRASVALSRIGPASVEPLVLLLNDTNPRIRILALSSLAFMKVEPAQQAVRSIASAPLLSGLAVNYTSFIAHGKKGMELVLAATLFRHGTKGMADTFLNCDNTLLEEAGLLWAEVNGYHIIPGSKRKGRSRWGSAISR